MNTRTLSIITILVSLILVVGCKSKKPEEEVFHESTDSLMPTTSTESATSVVRSINPSAEMHLDRASYNFIDYQGPVKDNVKEKLETFSPLTEILMQAQNAIATEDSLHNANNASIEIPSKDTVLFANKKARVHTAILAYRKMMASGPTFKDNCPNLLQLTRSVYDSSTNLLPSPAISQFFSKSDFFFIGGAPFVQKLHPADNATFTDLAGKPETRFVINLNENTNYILNSIYHTKKLPTVIEFGPPLGSYYGWRREIHGIGSLIHRFVNRIPAFFLTEEGVVPAFLTSVTVKLVPEAMGCVSDQPKVEFACAKSIEELDILGIYIPYDNSAPTTCAVKRSDNKLWTADLNGDGIDDLACVSVSFEGLASGSTLAEVLWFINIDGGWKIIDYAEDHDCT